MADLQVPENCQAEPIKRDMYCHPEKWGDLPHFSNRANKGAFLKGWRAWLEGKDEEFNPYADKRGPRGNCTWSRGLMRDWSLGWARAADRYVALTRGDRPLNGKDGSVLNKDARRS